MEGLTAFWKTIFDRSVGKNIVAINPLDFNKKTTLPLTQILYHLDLDKGRYFLEQLLLSKDENVLTHFQPILLANAERDELGKVLNGLVKGLNLKHIVTIENTPQLANILYLCAESDAFGGNTKATLSGQIFANTRKHNDTQKQLVHQSLTLAIKHRSLKLLHLITPQDGEEGEKHFSNLIEHYFDPKQHLELLIDEYNCLNSLSNIEQLHLLEKSVGQKRKKWVKSITSLTETMLEYFVIHPEEFAALKDNEKVITLFSNLVCSTPERAKKLLSSDKNHLEQLLVASYIVALNEVMQSPSATNIDKLNRLERMIAINQPDLSIPMLLYAWGLEEELKDYQNYYRLHPERNKDLLKLNSDNYSIIDLLQAPRNPSLELFVLNELYKYPEGEKHIDERPSEFDTGITANPAAYLDSCVAIGASTATLSHILDALTKGGKDLTPLHTYKEKISKALVTAFSQAESDTREIETLGSVLKRILNFDTIGFSHVRTYLNPILSSFTDKELLKEQLLRKFQQCSVDIADHSPDNAIWFLEFAIGQLSGNQPETKNPIRTSLIEYGNVEALIAYDHAHPNIAGMDRSNSLIKAITTGHTYIATYVYETHKVFYQSKIPDNQFKQTLVQAALNSPAPVEMLELLLGNQRENIEPILPNLMDDLVQWDSVFPRGQNLLHLIAQAEMPLQVLDCLDIYGKDGPPLDKLNQPDNKGYTPLHYAVEKGNPFMVAYLRKFGTDSTIRSTVGDNLTALELAQELKSKWEKHVDLRQDNIPTETMHDDVSESERSTSSLTIYEYIIDLLNTAPEDIEKSKYRLFDNEGSYSSHSSSTNGSNISLSPPSPLASSTSHTDLPPPPKAPPPKLPPPPPPRQHVFEESNGTLAMMSAIESFNSERFEAILKQSSVDAAALEKLDTYMTACEQGIEPSLQTRFGKAAKAIHLAINKAKENGTGR